MTEHTQNAFSDESNVDAAPRGRAVTAAGSPCDPSHPFAAYESGRFVLRPPVPDPAMPAPMFVYSSVDLPAVPPAPAAADAEAPAEAGPATGLPVMVPAAPEDDFADFEPVPLRARHDGWTPARQRQFLVELADCGIVREAAARVGMSEKAAWHLRRRAEKTPFHSAWEAALESGIGRLHSIAFQRAIEGVPKAVFYRGEKIGEHRLYDNRLLVSLLAKAGRPFDPSRALPVHDRWEAYLEAVEKGWRRPQARLQGARDDHVWMEEDGTWWTCFPPPEDCEVAEEGEYGEEEYCRTLSPAELEMVQAMGEREYEEDCAERDRFFGLEK